MCLSWDKEHVLIHDDVLGKTYVETCYAERRQRLPIYIPENQPDWIGALCVCVCLEIQGSTTST